MHFNAHEAAKLIFNYETAALFISIASIFLSASIVYKRINALKRDVKSTYAANDANRDLPKRIDRIQNSLGAIILGDFFLFKFVARIFERYGLESSAATIWTSIVCTFYILIASIIMANGLEKLRINLLERDDARQ